LEVFLELVECKFARNGSTDWKTCLTNSILKIIWYLFAGETHQVLKTTVTYCQPLWDFTVKGTGTIEVAPCEIVNIR
jgi:hypothetical protein